MRTYDPIDNYVPQLPESSFERFCLTCEDLPRQFAAGNAIMRLIDDGNFTLSHYHSLLLTIFHQVVVAGSTALALAGVMTDDRYLDLREYCLNHAAEERRHWRWIVQNLRDTGYTGPDPRDMFPPFPTQAYMSFSTAFSLKHPTESLAITYVLERLSSEFASEYAAKAAMQLKLCRDQVSFFADHGELDTAHSREVLGVLRNAPLTPYQWALCEYAARATLYFYKDMYNYAARRAFLANADPSTNRLYVVSVRPHL